MTSTRTRLDPQTRMCSPASGSRCHDFGCKRRPAAVLLHTAETDAALIDMASNLGVACVQLPAPGVLRESVRSVWDLGKSTFSAQLSL